MIKRSVVPARIVLTKRGEMTNYLLKSILILGSVLIGGAGRTAAAPVEFRASLVSDAIERPRLSSVVTPDFADCLQSHGTDTVKIWVFFTNKGVNSKAAFESAATSVTLTERAAHRRAKVDLNHVVFADLPVAQGYVNAIEQIGARHRRSSRWLNAATFEVAASRVDQIAQLPFVAEIKPMAQFRTPPEEPIGVESREPAPGGAQSVEVLDYGASYAQLNQIGVPAVHALGYSGAGVTLAILDSGFRKNHEALAAAIAEGRLLAEWDFVHNDGNTDAEATDSMASQPNHGTQVWSIAGGNAPGQLYGPAYGANFILCKTESLRYELPIEEDNWVAGMEFADSIGTDVLTTSLGYRIFDASCGCNYTYADMNGATATTSIAASMADGLGIVLCKSVGNEGPSAGSMSAPGDAFDILAVGNVDGNGTIAASSSRGPTFDGRIKPEVCARGTSVTTAFPSPTVTNMYTTGSGTSFATPLVAGAACLVIEARPDWTPREVREALKASGNHAVSPDNNYGWGVIRVDSALRINTGCCTGKVGNVNGLGGEEPTIGDVMLLIDFLFVSGTPPACMGEADVNLSGGAAPLKNDITIGDISMLIDHIFISGVPLNDCP